MVYPDSSSGRLLSPQRRRRPPGEPDRSPPPPLPPGAAAWLEVQHDEAGSPSPKRGSCDTSEPPQTTPPPSAADPLDSADAVETAAAADWLTAPSPAGPRVDALWRDFCSRCSASGVALSALSSAADSSVLALARGVGFDAVQGALLQAEWARRVRATDDDAVFGGGHRSLLPGDPTWAAVAKLLAAHVPAEAHLRLDLLKVDEVLTSGELSAAFTQSRPRQRWPQKPPVLLWHCPGQRGCRRGAAAAVAAVGFSVRPGRAGDAVYFPARAQSAGSLAPGVHCLVLAEVALGRIRVLEGAVPLPESTKEKVPWAGGSGFDSVFIPGSESCGDEYAVADATQCLPRFVATVRVAPAGADALPEGAEQLHADVCGPQAGADDAALRSVNSGELFAAAAEALRLCSIADRTAAGIDATADAALQHAAAQEAELSHAHESLQSELAVRVEAMRQQLDSEAAGAVAQLGAARQRVRALRRRLRTAAREATGMRSTKQQPADGSESDECQTPSSPTAMMGVPLERSEAAADLLQLTFGQGPWELPQVDVSCVCAAPITADLLSAAPADGRSVSASVASNASTNLPPPPDVADWAVDSAVMAAVRRPPGETGGVVSPPRSRAAPAALCASDSETLRALLSAGLAWAARCGASGDLTASGVVALQNAASAAGLPAQPYRSALADLPVRPPEPPPIIPAANTLRAGARVVLAGGNGEDATGTVEGPYDGKDPLFQGHWWVRLRSGRARLRTADDLTAVS